MGRAGRGRTQFIALTSPCDGGIGRYRLVVPPVPVVAVSVDRGLVVPPVPVVAVSVDTGLVVPLCCLQ